METIVTPENFQATLEKAKPNRLAKNLALWTMEYRKIRGQRFSFEGHKYLATIYQDNHPYKIIQKPSQVGISEYFINETFWLGEQGWNCLFVFPAESQLNDFSHARVDTAVEESEYLRSIVKGINNVGLKRIGKAFIYYRGSIEPRQLKTVDADALYFDELDEINPSMIPLAGKRLGHSRLNWRRAISTPTYPEVGINKMLLTSDYREWQIRCNHCKAWQVLDFWKNMVAESGKVLCQKCHNPLDRLADGEWVVRYPGRPVHGYDLGSRLICARTSIQEMIDNSKRTTQEEIQAFWNSDLGSTHVPEGGQLSPDILDVLRDDYVMPGVGRNCIMGIDVGEWLHVWICEPYNDKWRTVFIGAVKEFEELDGLVNRYDVKIAIVDGLPETRKATEFCKRFPGKAYYIFYTEKDIADKDYRYFKVDIDTQRISANRTMAGDYFLDGLTSRKNLLPRNARDLPDFYDHIQAEIRVVKKDANGISRASYINTKPDHYFHAGIYKEIAGRIASGIVQTTISDIGGSITIGESNRDSFAGILGNDREYLNPPIESQY